MANPGLVDYIKAQRALGHSFEQLREAIILRGWPIADTDDAIEAMKADEAAAKPAPPASPEPSSSMVEVSLQSQPAIQTGPSQESPAHAEAEDQASAETTLTPQPSSPVPALSEPSKPETVPSLPALSLEPRKPEGPATGALRTFSLDALTEPKAEPLMEPAFGPGGAMPEAPTAPDFAAVLGLRRPRTGAVLAAVFLLVAAAAFFIAVRLALAARAGGDPFATVPIAAVKEILQAYPIAVASVFIAFGVLAVLAAWGLWHMKHWGWGMALVLSLVGLASLLSMPWGFAAFCIFLLAIAALVRKKTVAAYKY